MKNWFKTQALYRSLLGKELKAKYKNTFLGYGWSLLMPLLQSAVFFVVFSLFLRFPIENYFLFLTIGLVVWQFFSNSLTQGANVLVANANLIRKTPVPRELFVSATVGAELVHLLVTLPVLLVLSLLCARHPGWETFYALPAGILSLVLFSRGLAGMVSILNAYFRDLERILQILLQIWFYVTPIFYRADQIPERFRFLFLFNPLYYPVELFRSCFYESGPEWKKAIAGVLCGLIVYLLGRCFFRRFERDLAEVL